MLNWFKAWGLRTPGGEVMHGAGKVSTNKGSAPSRHCHRRGLRYMARMHQAASHIPALNLPSRSRHSITDPERMEGCVSPGPGCKEQLAHGCYVTARSQQDSNQRPRGRWSSMLTTRLSRHVTAEKEQERQKKKAFLADDDDGLQQWSARINIYRI